MNSPTGQVKVITDNLCVSFSILAFPIDLNNKNRCKTMNLKKYGSILCGILILAGCLQQGPDLKFSAGPCDETIDPYTSNLGVKDVTWIDDTTLEVTAYVNINCAEEIKGGSFEIYGSRIVLVYNSPQCETCTFCLCAHKLTYRFTDLEKEEYIFELKRIS